MKLRSLLLTAALAASSLLLAPQAQAATNTNLTDADRAFVTEASERLGIPAPVRDRLMANLEKGILPLSMTGAEPTSTKTKKSPEQKVVRKEFADGSVSQTTFQLPTKVKASPAGSTNPTPMSVRNCVDYGGTGTFEFRSCDVRTDQVSYTLAFESDGRLGSSCSPTFAAKIYNIYGAWYSGVGAVGGITQEVLQGTQSCNGPARARASAIVSMGFYSFTASLTFYVQNGSRWDTSP